jgi:hypothetical protein
VLLFAGLALTLTAFVIMWRGPFHKLRAGRAGRKLAANLGSMSDQWLSEHRASSMN